MSHPDANQTHSNTFILYFTSYLYILFYRFRALQALLTTFVPHYSIQSLNLIIQILFPHNAAMKFAIYLLPALAAAAPLVIIDEGAGQAKTSVSHSTPIGVPSPLGINPVAPIIPDAHKERRGKSGDDNKSSDSKPHINVSGKVSRPLPRPPVSPPPQVKPPVVPPPQVKPPVVPPPQVKPPVVPPPQVKPPVVPPPQVKPPVGPLPGSPPPVKPSVPAPAPPAVSKPPTSHQVTWDPLAPVAPLIPIIYDQATKSAQPTPTPAPVAPVAPLAPIA
ncbi:hypothetical protein DM02DRAFT_711806 [Periconia macrospinosa]|uniref:Uncharacterized protein n=1 Tax=Periconia macrospinosa TaxID=97972 RepID=A0A2V1DPX4_9PLEO|nr:hypothetical protein DM02DRAFT_711806 [Periconia macrospinosa]